MNKLKKYLDYKLILVIWTALGVLLSGIFYISPPEEIYWYDIEKKTPIYEYFEYTVLITIVGIILIWGIGYLISKNKEQDQRDNL